ncbi:hypothetical protein LXL04_019107 [Taraxacum kok-saghyz]
MIAWQSEVIDEFCERRRRRGQVFEKFAGHIEAISNIEVCNDESIVSSEQTSIPISRSLKRSFQKIDDIDEAIEHIAKRLHNVNIDDDNN